MEYLVFPYYLVWYSRENEKGRNKALYTYYEGRLIWIFLSAADIITLYIKDCLSWFQEVGCKWVTERESVVLLTEVLVMCWWEAICLRKHLLHHGNVFGFNDETQAIKHTYRMLAIYIGFSCLQGTSLSRSYIK